MRFHVIQTHFRGVGGSPLQTFCLDYQAHIF